MARQRWKKPPESAQRHQTWGEHQCRFVSEPDCEGWRGTRIVAHLFGGKPGYPNAAWRRGCREIESYNRLVAQVGCEIQLSRTVLVFRDSERSGAQITFLRALGLNYCLSYDIAARANRWRFELGLSLCLVARRLFHSARALRTRIQRRFGSVRRLASACDTFDHPGI